MRPPCHTLKSLNLAHNPMHSELFRFFNSRRASHMTSKLTHLDMSHIFFSESAIAALCNPRILPALTHLSLAQTSMNDAAAHALLDSGIMSRLTHLDLRFNPNMEDQVRDLLVEHARTHHPALTLMIST